MRPRFGQDQHDNWPLYGTPYVDFHRERIRADLKHSANGKSMEERSIFDPLWLPVLTEEVGEVARALCDHSPLAHLREELVQVGAVAAAWITAIDEVDQEWPE